MGIESFDFLNLEDHGRITRQLSLNSDRDGLELIADIFVAHRKMVRDSTLNITLKLKFKNLFARLDNFLIVFQLLNLGKKLT